LVNDHNLLTWIYLRN